MRLVYLTVQNKKLERAPIFFMHSFYEIYKRKKDRKRRTDSSFQEKYKDRVKLYTKS